MLFAITVIGSIVTLGVMIIIRMTILASASTTILYAWLLL